MNMATSKNKIVEVLAAARIVAKSHGHTGKYAKHYVALSIEQPIERIFPRLKELFGLAKNRFIGIKKVAAHVFACLIAYWMRYA
ncbi:MAG: hypothetical protein QXF01_01030 [Candidatus Micrarchaeaceae archaeon]